jgi:hypothetical protein
MLANIRNALLLATSNRSEAAVGYATMDGDTSGGLSPIAGIDKAFLRRWLRWCEKYGPDGIGPLPELNVINEQAPTAELRPASSKQTDEDDLMPYELLDAIERAAIRDKQSPQEILLLMEVEFPQYSRPQLALWIERFFRLWCRNQWKRERMPQLPLRDENPTPRPVPLPHPQRRLRTRIGRIGKMAGIDSIPNPGLMGATLLVEYSMPSDKVCAAQRPRSPGDEALATPLVDEGGAAGRLTVRRPAGDPEEGQRAERWANR